MTFKHYLAFFGINGAAVASLVLYLIYGFSWAYNLVILSVLLHTGLGALGLLVVFTVCCCKTVNEKVYHERLGPLAESRKKKKLLRKLDLMIDLGFLLIFCVSGHWWLFSFYLLGNIFKFTYGACLDTYITEQEATKV